MMTMQQLWAEGASASSQRVEVMVAGENPGDPPQKMTLSLAPADVSTSAEMSTYLAGYKPGVFRADEVSPPVLVKKDTGTHRDFSSNDAFLTVDVKGSINGAIPEVDFESSTTSYTVVDRFLGAFINDITEQNAMADGAPLRPRQRAMRRVSWALQLDREIDVWTLLDTSGNWTAANTAIIAAGFQWNGGGSADPIRDLHTRIETSSQQVNGIWMNQQVANAFLRNPLVRDQMRAFGGDEAFTGSIRRVAAADTELVDFSVPGLPPIHVSAVKSRTTSGGTLSYVLPDSVILTRTPPAGVPLDGEDIATSYTFRREGNAGVGIETREFRVEGRGPRGGTMLVAAQADIATMTGSDVGGRLDDIIQ
jgi:hypothetical protein